MSRGSRGGRPRLCNCDTCAQCKRAKVKREKVYALRKRKVRDDSNRVGPMSYPVSKTTESYGFVPIEADPKRSLTISQLVEQRRAKSRVLPWME